MKPVSCSASASSLIRRFPGLRFACLSSERRRRGAGACAHAVDLDDDLPVDATPKPRSIGTSRVLMRGLRSAAIWKRRSTAIGVFFSGHAP